MTSHIDITIGTEDGFARSPVELTILDDVNRCAQALLDEALSLNVSSGIAVAAMLRAAAALIANSTVPEDRVDIARSLTDALHRDVALFTYNGVAVR